MWEGSFYHRYPPPQYLLIVSSSREKHMEHLRCVLQQLDDHGILINVHKSIIGVSSLIFLDYHVDATILCPLECKIQGVCDFPQPTSKCKLQKFLALVNCYWWSFPTQLNCFILSTACFPDLLLKFWNKVKMPLLLSHP